MLIFKEYNNKYIENPIKYTKILDFRRKHEKPSNLLQLINPRPPYVPKLIASRVTFPRKIRLMQLILLICLVNIAILIASTVNYGLM